jgi:DNA-directed RNA polymerase subunit M/transcription elongation factor TFIIS
MKPPGSAARGIVASLTGLQRASDEVDNRSMRSVKTTTETEACPKCGSVRLVLRGRTSRGDAFKEIVCRECSNSWQLERTPFAMRIRP